MTYANKFLAAGASFSPSTLAGSTRNSIAGALDNPASPITDAIIASANYQTAIICTLTGQQCFRNTQERGRPCVIDNKQVPARCRRMCDADDNDL